MTQEELQKFESGYNEGFMFAAQALASRFLRLIQNHPSWMLESDRRQAEASIKLTTERLLQKRGLIPFGHEVIMGRAERVILDFNIDY